MKTLILAAVASAIVATSSLQAAAAPRQVRHAPLVSASDQFRNANASLPFATGQDSYMSNRGNAGAAPAGR